MAKGALAGNGWNKFVIETEQLPVGAGGGGGGGDGGKVEESFSHQRGAVQIGTDHIQPTGIRIIEWDDTRWSSSTFGSAIGVSLSNSSLGFRGWTPTDSQESKTHPAGGKLLLHISVSARAKKKWRRSENFPQDTHTLAGETCENFSSCVATWKHESTPPQEWVGGLVGCWVGWLYVALRGTWQILRFTFWKISNTKLNLMRTRNICVRAAFHLGAICKTSRHRHRHRHPP